MQPIAASALVLMCASVTWGHSHSEVNGPGTKWEGDTVDKEHIKEHMEHKAKIDVDMAGEEELRFHYFKLHDLNNDTKLDGLEILAAMSHSHEGETHEQVAPEQMEQMLQQRTMMIDDILNYHDRNNDGYINYFEFRQKR